MAFSTFVGSFTVPATAIDKVITGVGFQPKVVLFWGNGMTADGVNSSAGATFSPFWGIGISSTSRVAMFEADDFATGNPTGTDATKCIKRCNGSTPTVTYAADFVTQASDGFTVHFTTGNASAMVVNFMALGGADLTNVSLLSFTSASANGNQTTTGAGFQPDAILLMGADTSSSNNSTVLGFGKSSTARGTSAQAANATTGGRIQKTTKVYCNIDGGSSVRCEADLVSPFNSDGFVLNWTTSSANTHTIYALCLKGGSFNVGAFTQKTSSGAQPITGIGFQPTGLFQLGVNQTAGAALGSIQYLYTAAASNSTHRGFTVYSSGAAATELLDRAHIYSAIDDSGSGTILARADFTSFDVSGGFTITYDVADATAREVIYLVMGNAPAVSAVVPRNTYMAPILTQ